MRKTVASIYIIGIAVVSLLAFPSCKKTATPENNTTPPVVVNNNPPGQFTLTVAALSWDTAKIEWTASVDPDRDSVTYKVFLNNTLVVQNYTQLNYIFRNLSPLTTYTAKVIAVDAKGKETANEISFTTKKIWLKYLKKVEYGPITGYSSQYVGQMIRANDGGYITVGHSQLGDWPYGPINTFTMKIDSLGNKVWQKRYNSLIGSAYENRIVNCNDGYIIAGNLSMMKINNSGDIVWMVSPNLPSEAINGMAVSTDGSIYTAGLAPTGPPNNVVVATLNKYDPGGSLIWSRQYSNTTRAEFHDLRIYGNELIALGRKGDPDADFWVVNLSLNGSVNWEKTYHDYAYAFPQNIIKTREGNYVFTGFSYDNNTGPYFYLQMIDPFGNSQWVYQVMDNRTRGYSVAETNDNALVVTGGYQLNYSADFALYKFDKNGSRLWEKLYNEFATYLMNKTVIPTSDGGYIINCQKSKSYNGGSETDQIYIFKTDDTGDFN